MLKQFLTTVALVTLSLSAQAKVKLPNILCDNMVLQQNTEARLWGWDKPGKKVNVTTSWNNETYTVKTGKDGKWLVSVKTPAASYQPLSITFDDGDGTVTLNNVLSGEVWVCAGQSNMEMPVKGFGNCPVEGYNEEVINARQYRGIHYVKIPSIMRINVRDNDGVNSVLIRQYNIQSIPTFFLVTKGNELYKRDEQMKDLEAEIRSLL